VNTNPARELKEMSPIFQPRPDLTAQHFRDAFNSDTGDGVLVTMSVNEGNVLPISLSSHKKTTKPLPFDVAASVVRRDASWRVYHMAAPAIAWGYEWDPRDNHRAVVAGAPYDCFSTWRHMRTGEFVWSSEIFIATVAILAACVVIGVHKTLQVRRHSWQWGALGAMAATSLVAQLMDCTMCWPHPLTKKNCIRRVLAFRRDRCPRMFCRFPEYYGAVLSGAVILAVYAALVTRGSVRSVRVASVAWGAIAGSVAGSVAVGGSRLNPVYGPDVDLWTEFITLTRRRDRETMPYNEAFAEFRRESRPPPAVLLLVLRGKTKAMDVEHSLDMLSTMLHEERPKVLVVWYAHPCGQPRFMGLVAYDQVTDLVRTRLSH
jgi:hypothetical protein